MKISYLWLETDVPLHHDDTQYLRGFFGNEYRDIPLFHHHLDDSGFIYLYPRIQYKVIGGHPLLMGISEGASALAKIVDTISTITIRDKNHTVTGTTLQQKVFEPSPCRGMREYRFLAPWMALNQKNVKRYESIHDHAQLKEFLNSILVANVLSFCKGVGIVCKTRLHAHSHLNHVKTTYKGIPMVAFTGKFRMNFLLPDYIGIGKAVSFGNGTVIKTTDHNKA